MDIEKYREQLKSQWNRKKALLFVGKAKDRRYELRFASFTGVKTLFRLALKKPNAINLERQIEKGEIEMVFVANETIIQLKDGSNHIPEGSYRVRVLGDKASGMLLLY